MTFSYRTMFGLGIAELWKLN